MKHVLVGMMLSCMAMAGMVWADSNPPTLDFTTDAPVYKLKGGMVKLTVHNLSKFSLHHNCSLKVQKGNQTILQLNAKCWDPMAPGEKKTLPVGWNKKDKNGKPAGAGSYTLSVGPFKFDNAPKMYWLSRTIALTETGRIAGTSHFPLALGNEWVYEMNHGPDVTPMISTTKVQPSPLWLASWSNVSNLLDKPSQYVAMVGDYLRVVSMPGGDVAVDVFHFNRKKGHTYEVNYPPFLKKVTVTGTNEKVVTPAGTFKGCYKLTTLEGFVMDHSFGSFWFAPGIGLVQYQKIQDLGGHTYSLRRARIQGPNMVWYTIGLN